MFYYYSIQTFASITPRQHDFHHKHARNVCKAYLKQTSYRTRKVFDAQCSICLLEMQENYEFSDSWKNKKAHGSLAICLTVQNPSRNGSFQAKTTGDNLDTYKTKRAVSELVLWPTYFSFIGLLTIRIIINCV